MSNEIMTKTITLTGTKKNILQAIAELKSAIEYDKLNVEVNTSYWDDKYENHTKAKTT